MGLEGHAVREELKQSGRGQWFGFFLALVLIASAVFLAVNGHDVVAGTLGGTTIVGLVTVFVVGKNSNRTPPKKINNQRGTSRSQFLAKAMGAFPNFLTLRIARR